MRHDDWREARRGIKVADLHHLGEVLVRLAKRVLPTPRKQIPFPIPRSQFPILRNHFLAATGIAGEGERRELFVLCDYPSADKRLDESYETRGMAAGVRYALRLRDCSAAAGEFGEAVLPAVRRAVGGRGVDDDGVRVLDERDRLYRRRIGEAEKGDIAGIQRVTPCRDVLTNFVGKHD